MTEYHNSVGKEQERDDVPLDLKSCLGRILRLDLYSDVEFIVGASKISFKAHTLILASRSAVFHAMFYGPLKEINQVISLEDCSAEGFGYVLKYIYTDEKRDIPVEHWMKCLYIATKYQLNAFMRYLELMSTHKISVDNVIDFVHDAIGMSHDKLFRHFIEFITLYAEKVLPSPSFKKSNRIILENVLPEDYLNVSKEVTVFQAVVEWGKQECYNRNLMPSAQKMKEILGSLLYDVRFICMTPEELTEHVLPTGLLTNDELVALFAYFHSYKEFPLPETLRRTSRKSRLAKLREHAREFNNYLSM